MFAAYFSDPITGLSEDTEKLQTVQFFPTNSPERRYLNHKEKKEPNLAVMQPHISQKIPDVHTKTAEQQRCITFPDADNMEPTHL